MVPQIIIRQKRAILPLFLMSWFQGLITRLRPSQYELLPGGYQITTLSLPRKLIALVIGTSITLLLLLTAFVYYPPPSRSRIRPPIVFPGGGPKHEGRPPKLEWDSPFAYPNEADDLTAEWWTYTPQEANWTWMMHGTPLDKYYIKPEVIPALSNAPPPSSYNCTTDLHPKAVRPLVLLGVFSTAKDLEARSLIRMFDGFGRNSKSPRVVTKFIMGSGAPKDEMKLVEYEQEKFNDIVVLDMKENMNEGKSHAFFQYVANLKGGDRPQFAFKMDTDTFIVMPNFLSSLSILDCSKSIYLGTTWGSWLDGGFPIYMRGQLYGFSWPLIAWIGSVNLPSNKIDGIEDLRSGTWLYSLPETESFSYVDYGPDLGDWVGNAAYLHKIGRHAMKTTADWVREARIMESLFKKNNRPFEWPS